MNSVEPKFKIGDLVTHAGFAGMVKSKRGEGFKFQALFIVSVLQEACSAGVQTHYYVRPLGHERYSNNTGFGTELFRIHEVELVPFVTEENVGG